ncbi:uracil-DNA glycosylase [Rubrimonas cliftonensis]|uniref:Type-4 uracil-DNA glycosylase n=1 Tax=Rubrimonas cliftonensis TaxID=89524 RepID=A0A1H4D728_9RHOB|nr:uracil-DNA glycosylase [Rubrimonas cliftonensis]SEA68102.1 DNA polymerase [Rubrimonas cliftonensis]
MSGGAVESWPPEAALAALAWQVELGCDEALSETPLDRFALEEAAEAAREARRRAEGEAGASPAEARDALARTIPARTIPARTAAPGVAANPVAANSAAAGAQRPAADAPAAAVAEAEAIAAGCATLDDLAVALAAFEGCPLKRGARSCVFADGDPAARVMVIGEAPGRDEDRVGKPFVGRSGQLLDRMLAAIGLDRRAAAGAAGVGEAVYITNAIPWRPVDNRAPSGDEIAMLLPFLRRHVALADPAFVLLAGNAPTRALAQTETGILRMRGRWLRLADGRSALPTLHPAYLLRNPAAKRLAWRDLLSLRAALDGEAPPC